MRHAYIHEPSKTLICWAPKVACTSIAQAVFYDILGKQSDDLDERLWLRRNGYRVEFPRVLELSRAGYKTVALVREPYSRLVSAYLNKFVVKQGNPLDAFEKYEIFAKNMYTTIAGDRLFRGISFSEFVRSCVEEIRRRGRGEASLNHHWNTQVPFAYLERGFCYDHLFPMEESERFFHAVGMTCGITAHQRHANRTPSPENPALAELADLPSMEFLATTALHHPANFEDATLRKRVERAYAPDMHYLALARGTPIARRRRPVQAIRRLFSKNQ